MKRIIAALALVPIAMAAFAADPKVILQTRVTGNLVTHYLDGDDSLEDSGVALPGKDIFGAEYKDENAGAYVAVQGQFAKDYSTTKASDSPLSIYDYYGWMKFGDLKVSAGEWEHRYASRVTGDLSSFGGIFDLYYGPMKLDAKKEGFINNAYESDNLTPWNAEFALDYAFENGVASVSTGNDKGDPHNAAEFFAARVGYRVEGTANLDATVSMRGKDMTVIGAFAEILAVEKLSLVVGYSGFRNAEDDAQNLNAGELRARYAVSDAMSVTTHNNVTLGEDSMILYDMVNLAYRLNDTVTPAFMLANTNVSGDAYADDLTGNLVTVRPGVTVSPRKGATIDAGCKLEYWKPGEGDGFTRVSIPVVFRVKF